MTGESFNLQDKPPMIDDETRVFSNEQMMIVLHKDPCGHSYVYFIGKDAYPQHVEDFFSSKGLGGTESKLVRPRIYIDPSSEQEAVAVPGRIVGLTANWSSPEDFKEEVLRVLHEGGLISDEILDAF